MRICYRGNELDETFESGLFSWSSLCKTSATITFVPTTAPPATFAPFPDEYCNDIRKACVSANLLVDECLQLLQTTSTDAGAKWDTCTCNPNLMRKFYSCEFLGNQSCLATGATLSRAWGYGTCSNFESVIGTGLVSNKTLTYMVKIASTDSCAFSRV